MSWLTTGQNCVTSFYFLYSRHSQQILIGINQSSLQQRYLHQMTDRGMAHIKRQIESDQKVYTGRIRVQAKCKRLPIPLP